MTTPIITPLNAMEQGGEVFLWASRWVDVVKSVSANATAYDLAAARTAMGLAAGASLFVVFSADGPFWANYYGTAAIPTAAIADGSGSVFSPDKQLLDKTITSLSFISTATQYVSMRFYRA